MSASPTAAESERVALVADDDPAARLMIRSSLEADGWTVEEASDGIAACDAVEHRRPAVVLLDVAMPHLDGFEACARLRAQPGGDVMPVMMITGFTDQSSISRAYEVGATDFLAKPVNSTILRQRVQSMYRASVATQALRAERDFVSAVVDTAPALVLILDAKGRILRFNKACERASGFSLEDVKHNCLWESLTAARDRERDRTAFEKLIADGRTTTYNSSWTTKDAATIGVVERRTARQGRQGWARRLHRARHDRAQPCRRKGAIPGVLRPANRPAEPSGDDRANWASAGSCGDDRQEQPASGALP